MDKLEAQVNGSFMDSATQEGAPPPTAPPPQLTSNDVESPSNASPKDDDASNSDVPSPEKSSVRQTSPQGYQCKLCTLVAPSQSALEEHMNIHTGSRPYHCVECGFSCSLQSTLTQHLATHHQKDVNNVGIDTPSYENNLERLKEQTLTESAPTAATTTTSQSDNLPTSGMVTSPVTTAAPPLQQLPTLPAAVPPSFHEHSKVFQCKLCTHISPTKTHLNEHMNVHSGKKPYKCLVCGFSSAFRSSLMRHLIVHTGTSKQYKCDQCHYQTPYKCNLQAHRRKRHSSSEHNNIDLSGYQPQSHHSTSPIHNNQGSLIQVQDPNKLMAHIGENNIDMRSRYPLSTEALNSFLPASAAAALNSNSGNRPQPPSPNGSNTSASNDAQEMFIQKNSTAGSESGDHPPLLEKNVTPNSNESMSDHKDVMDYTGATSINNDMPATTSASPPAPILNAALPGGPLGMPPVTLPPGSLPPTVTSPHGEISVITPLQWASAGFPIYRRKKEGGARKRKRTPVPKREFLVSPTGEDISDPWADNGRDSASGNGDSNSDVYRNVAREYAMKGDLSHGAVNGGLDLSRDSSFADQDMMNNGSPSSGDATKEDGMHSPGSVTGEGSLLTRSTQTDPSSSPNSQSQTSNSLDVASQLNKCPHCETYFADHVIFTLHMSCHGQRNPYQCSICGYTCRDKIEFTCHITRSQHIR